jgi:hypothetical protein
MPGGADVTLPEPEPVRVTSREYMARPNVAVSARAALIVTWQDPAPEHAPLQPRKTEPVAGVAVSATAVPDAYDSAQSLPQLMPAGVEVTVPTPSPARETVRV